MNMRKLILATALAGGTLTVSACDPTAVSTGGSVYYDSMMWNDYYSHDRPGYRPPPPPTNRPPRPEHPIARPPVARPPIHRPQPR